MLQGIDVNERFEFISKLDKTEPKTKFIFKPLSGSDMFGLQGKDESFIIVVLDKSIVEIQNMPEGLSKEDYIRSLKSNALNELFEKFNEINNLTDDDIKN